MTLRALGWCAVSTKAQADEDERFSLAQQESDFRTWCAANNADIVDVLRVPGHSRSYRSLEKLAADARARGIDAFDSLIEHLDAADFDVLYCRDADRFARKPSLLHLIVETIIEDCAARIYSSVDGWIDETNADIFAMVKGYTTSQEIKRLVKYRDWGMKKRAERGLRLSRVAFGFKVNEEDRLVPDRSVQHIFDDAVTLLLEGHGWMGFEHTLWTRYGHGKDNRPFSPRTFYNLFYRPVFWGHTAWRIQHKGANRLHVSSWAFDVDVPPPDGLTLFPNAHEPYFTGDKAERLKAELRRRLVTRGGMSPRNTTPFAGLIICASCLHVMTWRANTKRTWVGYRCSTNVRAHAHETRRTCMSTRNVTLAALETWLTPYLEYILETGDVSRLRKERARDDARARERLHAEVTALEEDARRLLHKRVPDALMQVHEQELEHLAQQLAAKRARLAELERSAAPVDTSAVHSAVQALRVSETVAAFWQQDGRTINQALHALFGNWRIFVLDGVVVQLDLNPGRRPHRRKS